jgi:hypothetical protein
VAWRKPAAKTAGEFWHVWKGAQRWNFWNHWTVCVRLRLERSAAIERLERFELLILNGLSHGRTRWREGISIVKGESSDDGVNLRTVQDFFLEQLLRDFMEQTNMGFQ